MKFLIVLTILCTVLSGVGCHYKISKDSAPANAVLGIPEFQLVMREVIGPKCLECHSDAGGNADGLNLETYANVKAELSGIKSAIDSGRMPKRRAPLTPQQKQLLDAWIAAGAPENSLSKPQPTPTPSPSPAPTPVPLPSPDPTPSEEPLPPARDWATVKALVIDSACLRCHSAPRNRGGVNLETYQNTLSEISRVDAAIRDGSMPLGNVPLTEEQKNLILEWIQNGAPEFATP